MSEISKSTEKTDDLRAVDLPRLVRLGTGDKVTVKGAIFIDGERKWSRVESVDKRRIKLKSPLYGSSVWLPDELGLHEPNAQTHPPDGLQ